MQEKAQKISPIKQRILQFADTLNISKRAFYETIGVSRGTLESPTGITEDVMAKFIARYPSVSLQWLILGVGGVYEEKNDDAKQAIYDLTMENTRLKNRIAELEGEKPSWGEKRHRLPVYPYRPSKKLQEHK